MTKEQPVARADKILVSDFDGTMARQDFYRLALESLVPGDTPNYWAEYRSGLITHFQALQKYFAAIRVSETEVLAVVERMELDPNLRSAVGELRLAGWDVVVTSAGCEWYIRRLLAEAGVRIEVHSNPGRFVTGKGLLMEMPAGSPYLSATQGIDKAQVVRQHLSEGKTVAFAGDGFTDVEPAKLVPAELRFARGDLADVLGREGLSFHPFERWSEIAAQILRGSS